MRYPLNFDWDFYLDADRSNPPQRVDLPHNRVNLPYNYFSHTAYEGVSVYEKDLPPLDLGPGERLFLQCHGVMAQAQVSLNGHLLGDHKGGYTPFAFELTKHLEKEGNRLSLKVDSSEDPTMPPFGHVVDFLTYGGIYREVELRKRPANFLSSVKIETKRVLNPEKVVYIHLVFDKTPDDPLHLVIRDGEGVVLEKEEVVTSREVTLVYALENLKLWDLDHPHLYTLVLSFLGESTEHRFGVRDARFTEEGFYLNGQKIKIRGLNRHQSYPYVGYAMPRSAQEKDAEILKKDLACHMVRTSHYPQSEHFLNRCDELGLLVFEELPGWQHIGDEAWKEVSLSNLADMIKAHWNHPSIVIWGVRINESADDEDFYEKTNALARTLDPTRPTGGVRNFAGSQVFEDVYTYNDFVHRGDNQALDAPRKIAKKTMPYLVTEHNGHMFPTKKFDHEKKRLEHALRHGRVLSEMGQSDQISGAIGWCLFDYNTHQDFGSGDGICHHGVLDLFRLPKLAASVYASQAKEGPYLEVSSHMDIGEHAGGSIGEIMAFTNCDAVDLYRKDVFIKRFERRGDLLPGLDFPPIVIDDLIGSRIHDEEDLSARDADLLKDILLKVSAHGLDNLSLADKAKMGVVMKRNKLTMEDGAALFTKYIGNWGQEALVYRFVGIVDGEEVIEQRRGPSFDLSLVVKADAGRLEADETYDVTRIVVKVVSAYGADCPYYEDVVSVETSEEIEVIGPRVFSLIGGSRAFWVRTKGAGTGRVKVKSERLGEKDLSLEVAVTTVGWKKA